jgi:hypothetical protein
MFTAICDFFAEKADLSGVRLNQSDRRLQQSRLSTARRSENYSRFALAQSKTHIPQRPEIAELRTHIVELYERFNVFGHLGFSQIDEYLIYQQRYKEDPDG